MKCPNCGTKNPDNVSVCQKCGRGFLRTGPKKEPEGFLDNMKDSVFDMLSSSDKRLSFLKKFPNTTFLVMILILIIILSISGTMFAFKDTNIAINVNSAFYTDNIVDEKPVNGQFLIMNVSVKNNGKDTVKISADQFTPEINGNPVEKYSVFTGKGTDLPENIEVQPGKSKDLIIALDIGCQKPDLLKYSSSFWDSNRQINTPIKEIGNSALFDGMNEKFNTNMSITATGNTQRSNTLVETTYYKTDDLNLVRFIEEIEATINGESNSETLQDTIDINTGLSQEGKQSNNILSSNLKNVGDSTEISNETARLRGSEKINIMGKKVDCWVVESNMKLDEGVNPSITLYYDKTTRILLKIVSNSQTTVSGAPVTFIMSGELVSTNMPIIGVN